MMLNIRLFSFGPTAPWHVCTRKRGSTGKKSFRQCIDLATVGLAEVGQRSEWSVAIMAAWQEIRCCPNTRLPQISSHFPLRVRQPFSRGGKICGNQSNSTQRTSTADRRWERPINRTGGGENHFQPSCLAAAIRKIGDEALICYALVSVKT